MEKNELLSILSLHIPSLQAEDLAPFEANFVRSSFKKGDIIVSNKGMCSTCYFLVDGFVRSYVEEEKSEKTLWFGERGDLISSYQTLFMNKQGRDNVMALTNGILYSVPMDLFKKWVSENTIFTKIYIKIIESGYYFWENRYLIQSNMNVENRYNEWLARTKHLAPYMPLGILAQYLNIDQATLSRIRAKQKLKDN